MSEKERAKKDYLQILKALQELPFPVGKKLLGEFLNGTTTHSSIINHRLDTLPSFGSLIYTTEELNTLIDYLERKRLLRYDSVKGKRFWKVLVLTPKGVKELKEPQLDLHERNVIIQSTTITPEDRKVFEQFPHLDTYNDEQKKAIISPHHNILCIAGAGSGKTTVLTKRIEYLVRYKGVEPHRILAITFTRKARKEMQERLGDCDVHVETFNSFCEKQLRIHGQLLYDRTMKVCTYSDKVKLVRQALARIDLRIPRALALYFTSAQQRHKTSEQLFATFVNDCFFIVDYFKTQNSPIEDFTEDAQDRVSARMIYSVCKYLEAAMRKYGLRDFTDQMIDTITLYGKHPQLIPRYSHILVDEYQDVNDTQVTLLNMLGAQYRFSVGDPRQSIFGWRGSRIDHILDLAEDKNSQVITLDKNYRSSPAIVQLMNKVIAPMQLPDIHAVLETKKDIKLLHFSSTNLEQEFVVQKILESELPRQEIFVLARTNKQLKELSTKLRQRKIAHVIKNDEIRHSVEAKPGQITLATVHAIKGLEAQLVFVIGCTSTNFPCKTSEHPVLDLVKVDTYDKEEEERRLFYVAISRAKKHLYMTYATKRKTTYLTSDMLTLVGKSKKIAVFERLKQWRSETARILSVPPYMVLHDTALSEIAEQKPTSKEELLGLRGFGPSKVHRYGDAILKIVHG
ncbi:AAA family ATPase [Candidatus Woesearchaeota archaeon]|nr:AAA family ATPase [Candidatus Woesearchaeota archaeon]